MSVPSPAPFDDSFDTFYNTQQAQRQSSSASQNSQHSNGHRNSQSFSQSWQGDRPMMEEPHTLSRKGSNASLASHHSRARSTSGAGQMPGSGEWRQESLPFDPELSSTLIATAQQDQHHLHGMQSMAGMHGLGNHEMIQQIPDYQQNVQSYGTMPQMPTDQYLQYNQDSQNSPFSIPTTGMENFLQNGMQHQQGNANWGNDFVDQQDPQSDGLMQELERM